jgi:beta-glucanase (GH16 family)
LDNIKVQKHANDYYAKKQPMYFLVNLATGGGWETDLMRYDGIIDMYVDYIRVYSGAQTNDFLPETQDVNFKVYPNPVSSEATISLYSSEKENISISLHNIWGEQVFSSRIRQQGDVRIPADMSNLNNGIYLMKITAGNMRANRLVIKQ